MWSTDGWPVEGDFPSLPRPGDDSQTPPVAVSLRPSEGID